MDTNKAHALVEYLMRHERAVTAKELAGFLNFSVRSVKSYIAAINGEAREPLIVSGHSGYTGASGSGTGISSGNTTAKRAAGL